jgi:hypothetical protein
MLIMMMLRLSKMNFVAIKHVDNVLLLLLLLMMIVNLWEMNFVVIQVC